MAKKLYTHKQIRKNIKRDELRDLADKAVTFAKTNTENLLISAVILVVIAFLVPLYLNHLETSERRAAAMYTTAVNHYLRPLAGQSAAAGGEMLRTVEEKYGKSQQAFAEVAGTYKNTRAGKLAKLGQANSFFFQGKYAEALAIYEVEQAQHSQDSLGATIQLRMAQCQESLGKPQEALAVYQVIYQQDPKNFIQAAARLGMARCHAQLGQKAEAEKILQELEKQGDYWGEAARRQLTLLARADAGK